MGYHRYSSNLKLQTHDQIIIFFLQLQYTCGQEDMGGPPGCLQYYTGDTGLVKSFAYPTTNTAGAAQSISSTHLQNQNYQVYLKYVLKS